jgi:translation elongation factor EF-4
LVCFTFSKFDSDGSQGIQAQTLANYYLALEQSVQIIPVITKIDLEATRIEQIEQEMIDTLGVEKNDIIKISARSGLNCEKIFTKLIHGSTKPQGDMNKPLKGLIFDSWYDEFYGVICLIQVVDGKIEIGDKISLFHNKQSYTISGLGILTPELIQCKKILTGQGFKKVSLKLPQLVISFVE